MGEQTGWIPSTQFNSPLLPPANCRHAAFLLLPDLPPVPLPLGDAPTTGGHCSGTATDCTPSAQFL